MDPQKSNARRAWQRREEIRRQSATDWQPEVFTPKEGKNMYANENPNRRRNVIGSLLSCLVLLVVVVSCVGIVIYVAKHPQVIPGYGYQAPAAATQAPAVADAPAAVEPVAPAAVTDAPAAIEPTPAPVAVSCNTPSIKAGLTAAEKEMGLFLDTILGKRMTFTSRSLLIPEKEWNVELTSTELKTVEETWQTISVCVPEGMSGRVFAGGFSQSVNRYENGVLMTLQPGYYEFNLRNGEIVLWYPQQDEFSSKDLTRIVEQVRNGNFDIHSPLDFFGVTTDLLPAIPADLVSERNVQIVPTPEPVVK